MMRMGLRPRGATFGGAQLPRIADDKLLELILDTTDEHMVDVVATLERLRKGTALTVAERDRWIHVAQTAGLLKKAAPMPRPHRQMSTHDPDPFSAARTPGTERASEHLRVWSRPGGQMPMPPGRGR